MTPEQERLALLEEVVAEIALLCVTPQPRLMPFDVLRILGKLNQTPTKTTNTK